MSGLRFTRRVAASAVTVLLDRERLVAMYATRSRHELADELGVSYYTLQRAMRHHKIPCRSRRAESPAGMLREGQRAAVRLLVWRAYLRADRCPPDCPGREGCLNNEGMCALIERQRGAR